MNIEEVQRRLCFYTVKKNLESRMFGNLHVRFGVGGGVQFPALHHVRLMYSRQDQWREDALLILFECNKPWSFDRPPYLRGKLVKRVTSLAKELPEQRRTQTRLLSRGSPSR